jgi:hypothetical protein
MGREGPCSQLRQRVVLYLRLGMVDMRTKEGKAEGEDYLL